MNALDRLWTMDIKGNQKCSESKDSHLQYECYLTEHMQVLDNSQCTGSKFLSTNDYEELLTYTGRVG